jgi:hypothetical protein
MSGEQTEGDLDPVADLGRSRPALCRQVDGAVALALAPGIDHFVGHVHGLVVADPDRTNHAGTLLHAVPLQLDPGEAVAEE